MRTAQLLQVAKHDLSVRHGLPGLVGHDTSVAGEHGSLGHR